MGIDPREIDTWPASVLEDFRALDILEPFGPARDNWHAAQVAYMIALAHSDPKKRRPRFDDFMYKDPYTIDEEKIAEADNFFFSSKGKH